MSLRRLLLSLLALALVWAPVAVYNGSAMAMAPADHEGQMIAQGHCDTEGAGEQSDKSASHACCVAMLTALQAPLGPAVEPHMIVSVPERHFLWEYDHSFLAELPTPPPRLA